MIYNECSDSFIDENGHQFRYDPDYRPGLGEYENKGWPPRVFVCPYSISDLYKMTTKNDNNSQKGK